MSVLDYNIEAEQSVLGSMLIDRRCIGSVLIQLREEDFSPVNRPLLNAISSLFAANKRVDAVTVLSLLRKNGMNAEESRSWVMGIVDITPTAANVGEYVAIVKEQSRVRAAHEVAELMLKAKSSDAILRAMEHISEALSSKHSDRTKNMVDLSTEFFAWLENPKPQEFLPTTIRQLDKLLLLEKGMYMVLGGFPSDGKTMLALQMGMEMAKKYKVGLFFFEGKTLQAVRRMYSAISGISFRCLRRRKLAPKDYEDLAVTSVAINSLQFEAVEATGFRAADVRAMAAARGYDVVIIDYLQLIEPDNWRDDDTRAVTRASKQIRAMCVEMDVLTIALSQFRRLEGGKRRAPTMADLRQSGQIEQDANIICLLSEAGVESWEKDDGYNADRVPQDAEGRLLQIAKNREGERGGWFHLLMWGDMQRMEYYDPSKPPKPSEPEYKQEFIDLGPGPTPFDAPRRK